MTSYTKISPRDLDNLEYVGRSSNAVGALVDEESAGRLLIAGLVQKVDPSIAGNAAMIITDKGRTFLIDHRAREEKYGAVWNPPLDKGDVALEERHLPDSDLVTLIVEQADRFLRVYVLKKEHDAQSGLPIWVNTEDPALIGTRTQAEEYLSSTVASLGGRY